jgi:hypothetical protein
VERAQQKTDLWKKGMSDPESKKKKSAAFDPLMNDGGLFANHRPTVRPKQDTPLLLGEFLQEVCVCTRV